MKKIIHVGYEHSEKDTRIFEKECLSLAKKPNYQITYITSEKSGASPGEYCERGVAIRILPIVNKRYVRLLYYLRDLKKELLLRDADLYHIHEPWLIPVIAGSLKRHGKTVIFDMHELYREQFMQRRGFAAKIIGHLYRAYERYALPKLDAVIFPCRVRGGDPLEGFALKRPTVYIDNLPITEEPDPALMAEAEKNIDSLMAGFDPKGAPVCVYAGSLSEIRGITSAVKGSFLAGAKLVLAGQFESASYEERLRSMPEWECVTYVGTLSQMEVRALNRHCDIGLSTLLNAGQYYSVDNLPTKVHEYLQQGMPVIINDSPFNVSLLNDYRIGFAVDPSDPEEIAEAIRTISRDPGLSEAMGEEGRRAVKERFSWSFEEKKLYVLYEELLGE